MDKAPDAFRTISEVADELDLPQHVLRFWESRFVQIKPMKRGGGRRYYRPDDVDLLRGIRHLLYGEGYTIRGVQRILREDGVRFVQTVWQEGAPQPRHGVAADSDDGDDMDDIESADAPASERGGRRLLGLLPSLRGRDDDEPDDDLADLDIGDVPQEDRREPPMRAAPMPKLTPQDRPAAVAATDLPASTSPRPSPTALSREDVRALQSVLHELSECRRLIEAALTERD